MSDGVFQEIFNDLFTKEEWDLWVKGEFNLFDNYVERMGMRKEDADRLRAQFDKPKGEQISRYQEFIQNPLTLPKE